MKQLSTTRSICLQCETAIPAMIGEKDGKIYLRKNCPRHGEQTGLISSDAGWYHRIVSFAPAPDPPPARFSAGGTGCPLDCGFCPGHRQRMYLPVVSITSACNLNCPVCYTINRQQTPFFMSLEEFSRILDVIQSDDAPVQIINFTGGEPTLHPDLPVMVDRCRQAGIHRITISTNGLRFLEDPELLPRLAELQARIVLSFNSFRRHPYLVSAGRDLLEQKLAILELLARYKPSTSLLTVVMAGVNGEETGAIVRFVLESDFIVSSQIHTVTYTGQATGTFDRSTRVTTPDIIRAIAADNPQISAGDFLPSPCAHPLCYANCYLLKLDEKETLPLRRFIPEPDLYRLLTGNFYMEPARRAEEILNDAINDLWSRPAPSELDSRILSGLRRLVRSMFPSPAIGYLQRQQIAEQHLKAIYIASHMDDENFDLERIANCCVTVPDASGRLIPTCAYNNIYRRRDRRFCPAE